MSNQKNQNKVIFLDRDGVINQNSDDYVKSIDEFIFLPGSLDAISKLTDAGYRIGIATNQVGVSKGCFELETLTAIHHKMCYQIEKAGGKIDVIESCIHLNDENCFCRKPKPGMLFALANKLNNDITSTYFVGDKLSDVEAGLNARAKPIVVLSSQTESEQIKLLYPHVSIFDSLYSFVECLILTELKY